MIKDVIISVVGVQSVDGERDTVELTTEGRFGKKDEKYFLTYDEGQLTGTGIVKTKIFINSPDSVVLQRNGDINSRMEIIKGKRNTCFYSTPVGEINLCVYGEKIQVDLDKSGGSIDLEYTLDSNLKLIGRNSVKITVREV